MIDTDKYEGHTPGRWKRSSICGFKSESVFDKSGRQIASVKLAGYDTKRVKETSTNLLLIADAPLLLEEFKRLQKRNEWLEEVVALLQEDCVDWEFQGYPLWEGEEE